MLPPSRIKILIQRYEKTMTYANVYLQSIYRNVKKKYGKVIQGVYTPFNLFRKVYLNISSLNPR